MDQSKDIRVVALDVYGTILPTKGEPAKRKGLENFIIKLKNKNIANKKTKSKRQLRNELQNL